MIDTQAGRDGTSDRKQCSAPNTSHVALRREAATPHSTNMSTERFRIEKAREDDRRAILDVMRHWNMHHVPSPEMEELDLDHFFVALAGDGVIGAAGYKILSQTLGKTTLLGVLPDFNGRGVGAALQHARCQAMHRVGVKRVVTNCDLPQTIDWYKRRFGYKQVGTLRKVRSFGDPGIDHWTTLEMDLEAYMRRADKSEAQRRYTARHEPHPLAPYPPLLINACLTGMIPTRDQTPSRFMMPARGSCTCMPVKPMANPRGGPRSTSASSRASGGRGRR